MNELKTLPASCTRLRHSGQIFLEAGQDRGPSGFNTKESHLAGQNPCLWTGKANPRAVRGVLRTH